MIGCPAPNHKRTKKGHPLCNAERVGSSCACSVLPDWPHIELEKSDTGAFVSCSDIEEIINEPDKA